MGKKQLPCFINCSQTMAVTSKVFLAFSILCIGICYSNAKNLTKWGDCENYVLVGRDKIVERPNIFGSRIRVLKFPPVRHGHLQSETFLNDSLILGISYTEFYNQRHKSF